VLQDVHWFSGRVGGAFQGYTLGNILGAQFFQAALTAQPEIPSQIAQGRFDALHGWLVQNLYQHGRKFSTSELVARTTGGPIRIEPYLNYLKGKYGALYSL
jgi:carboxypeptidase Taq